MNQSPRFQLYSFKTRLLTVLAAFVLCFVAVLGRVFYLQILKADYYTEKAKSQHERTLTLEPRRGRILDKKGNKSWNKKFWYAMHGRLWEFR